VAAYAFGMTWLILKILDRFEPVRVSDEVERQAWTGSSTARRRTF
jgi:ammonia channel protein AmtB